MSDPADTCQHCKRPPAIRMLLNHAGWPWVASRVGPDAAWVHNYCSEECFEHADTHSAIAWRAAFGSSVPPPPPVPDPLASLSSEVSAAQKLGRAMLEVDLELTLLARNQHGRIAVRARQMAKNRRQVELQFQPDIIAAMSPEQIARACADAIADIDREEGGEGQGA